MKVDKFKDFDYNSKKINESGNPESSKIERLIDTYENIKTVDDIKKFVHDLVTAMDLSFHPDTDFTDYIDRSDKRTFTDEQSIELNKILDTAFDIAETEGVDIYDISMDVVNDINKDINESADSNEEDLYHEIDWMDLKVKAMEFAEEKGIPTVGAGMLFGFIKREIEKNKMTK